VRRDTDSEGLVLDAGVFIALERRDGFVVSLLDKAKRAKVPLVTSAAVVSQVWRGGGGRQTPIALLLHHVDVADLSRPVARVLGLVLGRAATTDVVDAHVAYLAITRDWTVLTSDPEDLLRLDPKLRIVRV
jgi:predicted nucleic acid-binding protein